MAQNPRFPLWKFLGAFLLTLLIFYLFYYSSIYEDHLMKPYLTGLARISSVVLNTLGYGTDVAGDAIFNSEFRVHIRGGCDGLEGIALFVAGILSFPYANWKHKLKGLAAGLLVLGIVNIARIVILFITGIHFPKLFEFLHLHGGVVLYTLFAIFLWIYWVRSLNVSGN